MVKLLMIRVPYHTPQDGVNDAKHANRCTRTQVHAASVMCLHSQSTGQPLCNIVMHLIALLNIMQPKICARLLDRKAR